MPSPPNFSFPAKHPQVPPVRQEFVVCKVTRSIWAPVDPKTHLSTNNMPIALQDPQLGLVGYG